MHDAIVLADGYTVIHGEANGQVSEKGIPATFARIFAQYMHTRNYQTFGHWIHRSAVRAGELVPELGLNGYEVLAHNDQVARWKRQNVSMPFTMRPRFSRMRGKRRSMRKMWTMKEMMVAQMAPMEAYCGMSR